MKVKQFIEIELEVSGDYIPEVVGSLSGLPENCYPPEPAAFEISEVKIRVLNGKGKPILIDCPKEIIDKIDYNDLVNDASDQYYDTLYG